MVSAAEADCAKQLAKLMPQFKSNVVDCAFFFFFFFNHATKGLSEDKEKLLKQGQEDAKARNGRKREEESKIRAQHAEALEARLCEMRENAASVTAAAALDEMRAADGKSQRIRAYRRWEAKVEEERRQRIAARDAKTQELEESARIALEERSEKKTALIEAIQNKLVKGTASASSSQIEDVVDLDAAKAELDQLSKELEEAKAAEAEKEASRKMVENGVRENFARKAQQLDDAESSLASGDGDEEGGDGLLGKGEKVLAKRKATDTEWLPARVEYATSDGKYLVSFDHNKSRMLCAANLVRKADSDNSRRATKEMGSKGEEERRKIEASRQAAVEVCCIRSLFFCFFP